MGGSSKAQTVGYRYNVGMHCVFVHGPIDRIISIMFDDREAWSGDGVGGQITISAEDLYGGDTREGGVSGVVDIEMGGPSQGQNSYLLSRIGAAMPAFRGVVGLVLRQFYMGMNPYLKRISARAKRTQVRQDGIAQWYLAKCEIPNLSISSMVLNERFTDGYAGWNVETGPAGAFTIYEGCLRVRGNMGDTISRLAKTVSPPAAWNYVRAKFCIEQIVAEDVGLLEFYTESNAQIFGLSLLRESYSDSLRRTWCGVNGSSIMYLTDSALSINVWYEVNVRIDAATNTVRAGIVRLDTGEYVKPEQIVAFVGAGTQIGKVVIRNENGLSNAGSILWDDIVIVNTLTADMNPAHIIRECLTDPDWGMGYTDADIDDDSFEASADRLYLEEFGVSLLWDRQTTIEDFVKEVVKHIDAALYVDRNTGKFVLNLVRSDFDEETLLHLDESNIEKITDFSRPTFDELTNSVTVQYWDSATDTDASVTIQDIALVQMQGATINTTIQYPGIANKTIAIKVAERDLKTLSTPLIKCTIYANSDAGELNIGKTFKLSWKDYEIEEVVMRVTGIAFGDGRNNRVRITATQDVFTLPDSLIISPTPPAWVDPNQPPQPIVDQIAFETPYLELVQQFGQTVVDAEIAANEDVGYFTAAALRPQSNAINAKVMADDGSGFVDAGTVDFCPGAMLGEDILQDATTFELDDATEISEALIGTWCQVNNEIMTVVDVDNNEITVKRGCLDTVPAEHAQGDPIFFWDLYGQTSATEYVRSDEIDVALLTLTGSGQSSIANAQIDTVVMDARAARPYPPANLEVDGRYYPINYDVATVSTYTWNHRDRKQQTANTPIGEGDGDVGPEAGTTYEFVGSIIKSDDSIVPNWVVENVGALKTFTLDTDDYTVPAGAVKLIASVRAVRDALISWQSPSVIVGLSGAPPARLPEDFTTYVEVDAGARITVTALRVTANSLARFNTGLVYKDFGVNHFTGNTEINFDFRITSIGSTGVLGQLLLSNTIGHSGLQTNCHYVFTYNDGSVTTLRVAQMVSSTVTASIMNISVGTTYFCRFVRDMSVGTYGTLRLHVASSDANRAAGIWVNTLSVTLTNNQQFRYIYSMWNLNDGQGAQASGYLENMLINSP